MKRNLGQLDRTLRVIIGTVLILFTFFSGNLWGLFGIIPLATALLSYCPIYGLFNISTTKKIESEKLDVG